MPKPGLAHAAIMRFENKQFLQADDLVVVEEPMEIRLGYGPVNSRLQRSIAVTMRTPGHDFELAAGFLYTEQIIHSINDINTIRYCTEAQTVEANDNIIRVELMPDVSFDTKKLQRNFYTTSSCGICGKETIEAVMMTCEKIQLKKNYTLSPDFITQLPDALRNAQKVFAHTGGLHACGLFSFDGELVLLREDVGRHNALDKLIGAALSLNPVLLKDSILMLSGRAGFELIQKAAVAGIPCICSVGAPSSLSVQMAKSLGITLIGFLKKDRFNIYNDTLQLIT